MQRLFEVQSTKNREIRIYMYIQMSEVSVDFV